MSIVDTLLKDSEFLFSAVTQHPGDRGHLKFAYLYFRANKDVIADVLQKLYALPEVERKNVDPYPNDRAWTGGHYELAGAVISDSAWEDFTHDHSGGPPVTDDDINMLIRALRIAAKSAAVHTTEVLLLMSPVAQVYQSLRTGSGWDVLTG
jgi:hypothetical protein